MNAGENRERPLRRTVALAGATGLVGRSILDGLLADTSVKAVQVFGRWRPRTVHAQLESHIVDFGALPAPPVDEVYLARGATIRAAGSQAAFRAVDFDANLAVARRAGVGRPASGLVSAMGADARSRIFYNRVKDSLCG
jgi:uncharacterized protein YbjT (DUF2867 family)